MNSYWFKPREFGYGVTPVTWEGWVLTVVTMCIVVTSSMLAPVLGQGRSGGFIALVIDLSAIAAFILISYSKTDGEWQWRSRRSPAGKKSGVN